ncbi:endonuclease [Flavobacterium psychrotolerans]|uniref:Ribonuclease n=1 Tax=Flavobacterium psychrotolerans TaxID=2169410 RepID=A0A2U1JMX5_9FLAO|nr:endonuclease [Flavobacterium psychrotolerans]PWA06233.1 ribonuclease [Flavobacterium psychrotolerans]
MMKNTFFAMVFLYACASYGQVVINELDADTPSSDILEFVELKSTTANFPLDGYVLVFFNGTTAGTATTSYYSIDLDGLKTDVNGIIHLGNQTVSPTPALTFGTATIQNGPDAVALYLGNATDFPNNTLATATGLIDALAYSNGATTKPTALMAIFGLTVCVNENQTLAVQTHSIQRKNDGTYEVKTPTPGVNNDGSGILFNYVTTSTNLTTIDEGQNLIITSTVSKVIVNSPLVLNFTLNNGSFKASDYSGNLSITIPVGATSGSATIKILNDGVNEGDEELKIQLTSPSVEYYFNNNSLIIRVNDINFTVLPFGTPLNPTYGLVANTAPAGYYASIEGLSGAALKQGLQDIIANPAVVHAHVYGDIYAILKKSDQNPANSNQVWLMYVEEPRSKIDYQVGNSIIGKWNREHIYCQSRGGFADATSSTPQGINVWTTTGPDVIATGHGDAHHIRAEDGQENSSRNNRNYGVDYNGPIGSQGSWHGDVARSVFYMAVRYNALSVVNGDTTESNIGQIGDLATLLDWNQTDKADDFEMNRNNYIYTWQVNRNPFIDYPNLADYIFGAKVGQQWFSTLSTNDFSDSKVVIYPNPAKDFITVFGISDQSTIEIYSLSGAKLFNTSFIGETRLRIDLASGIYLAKITSDNKTLYKKIVIK